MKRLTTLAGVLAMAYVFTGCIAVYTPALGVIYTEVYGPIDAGEQVGAKEGTSCAQSVLGLVATGDASIKAAAKAGDITRIQSVDHYTRNIIGILGEFCTIVRGS